MAARIQLTKKQQAEYETLSKRFKITKRQYINLYNDVRRSRRKSQRIENSATQQRPPWFTLKLDNVLRSKADYTQFRTRLTTFLNRNFEYRQTKKRREDLYARLKAQFTKAGYGAEGKEAAQKLIDKLKKLSNKDFWDFINNHSYFKFVTFYPRDHGIFSMIQHDINTITEANTELGVK